MSASRGIYARLLDHLEELYVYNGVGYTAIADVFQLNRRTLTARLNDIGANEVKALRDTDVAADKKVDLIIEGVLPPASASNLDPERHEILRKAGIPVTTFIPAGTIAIPDAHVMQEVIRHVQRGPANLALLAKRSKEGRL